MGRRARLSFPCFSKSHSPHGLQSSLINPSETSLLRCCGSLPCEMSHSAPVYCHVLILTPCLRTDITYLLGSKSIVPTTCHLRFQHSLPSIFALRFKSSIMKSFLLPIAVLASAAVAQTTSACGAAYIVEACLSSERAKFDTCKADDYACKCNFQKSILTYEPSGGAARI